jgi:hypothetical protein
MAALTTTLLTVAGLAMAGAGVGFGIASMMGGKESTPATPTLPETPKPEDATARARAEALARQRKQRGRASTIMTSPEGAMGEAPVARKTLLGE